MELIDKVAIVAEIERLINDEFQCDSHDEATGFQRALDLIKSFLDTLEVKEVDLEKEISDYLAFYHLHIKDGGRIVFDNNDSPNFMCDIRHIAKWFFELGLKAQKGE